MKQMMQWMRAVIALAWTVALVGCGGGGGTESGGGVPPPDNRKVVTVPVGFALLEVLPGQEGQQEKLRSAQITARVEGDLPEIYEWQLDFSNVEPKPPSASFYLEYPNGNSHGSTCFVRYRNWIPLTPLNDPSFAIWNFNQVQYPESVGIIVTVRGRDNAVFQQRVTLDSDPF